MNTIQGNNVILALMKDDWVQLLCASDMTLSMSLETLENKTVGDGHFASFAHEKLSYTINVSGLAIMNDTDDQTNYSGFDTANAWIKSLYVLFRMSYYDDAGDIKSFQGNALVTGIAFNMTTGALVKDDCTLLGTGELLFFDGLIPCDSEITLISITGETAVDGIIHVTYTYTGAPYQVKYRIDGAGSWIYSLVGTTLDIPSLSIGAHSIEIIPVCANGYEGEGLSEDFQVTQGLTCASVISAITINGAVTTATPVYSASPNLNKYRFDGGMWNYAPISSIISLLGQSVGAHTIEMVPICFNGVEGTGFTQAFTITTMAAQSIISWDIITWKTGNTLYIYENGILILNESVNGTSGTVTVATGSTILVQWDCHDTFSSACTQQVEDTTLSTVLSSTSGTSPVTLSYTFTANGDDYDVSVVASP